MKRSGQTSMIVVVLLATTVALASSSVYLASVALQPKSPGGSLQGSVDAKLQPFNVTSVSGGGTASSSAQNSITVTGSGEASYTPDEALIQVGVQTENTTAQAATQRNAELVGRVISSLEAMGISNGSIQTEGYNLWTDYANCYSSCIPAITGYTVTNTIQVNVTSSSASELGLKAGQVIDTSVKAGANQVSLYFSATRSVVTSLENRALASAVASADNKAETIATSLGVSITGVISANDESGGYYQQPYYAGTFAPAQLASTTSSTPIVPGTQTITETVQVVYSI